MSERRAAYLQAMGIDQWVLRSAASAEPVLDKELAQVEVVNADKPVKLVGSVVEETVAEEVVVEAQPEPAFTFTPASLPSFPAQSEGNYIIVCAAPTDEEGQGSAFYGDVAVLFNKMLAATQWPTDQCVLFDQAENLDAVIEQSGAKIVIAFGQQAVKALLQKNIEQARQTAYPHSSGAKVFASYHPVAVHRDPDRLKRPLWEDIKLAMAEAAQ